MVAHINRYVWTSEGDVQGPGKGTIYMQLHVPEDAVFLPPTPTAMQGIDWQERYAWDNVNKTWIVKPEAMPVTVPEDYYAWDYSPRYDVDPSDPMRNSWVLKPDAQPVEQPEE